MKLKLAFIWGQSLDTIFFFFREFQHITYGVHS